MTDEAAMPTETPVLPAHVEDTIQAIAKLHADHRQEAGVLQLLVEQATAWIGQPHSITLLTALVMVWVVGNLLARQLGVTGWDAPPFAWLQGALTLMALYVTVLIVTTQRREERLAGHRAQLTLELAILGEQKSAKIIALLEELRRDHPHLRDRVDHEAAAMSVAADPQVVLDAIKGSHGVLLAGELATPPVDADPMASDLPPE